MDTDSFGPRYYNRQGEPIPLMEWAALFESLDERQVLSTHVGEFWVSTVLLGLDHSFGDGGPPLIFETAVFAGHTADADVEIMERYPTEEAARDGHLRAVELLSGKAPDALPASWPAPVDEPSS